MGARTMKKLESVWFEFAGARNTDKGVRLLSLPVRYHPAERGELIQVPGRDGYLWAADGAYDNVLTRVQCQTADDADMAAVSAWLRGAGELRFSDDPDRCYRARVTKEFSRSAAMNRFVNQTFTVTFDCQPFLYHREVADIILTASPATITNPGTYKSAPRLTIEGTGDAALTIGTQIVEVTELAGGVIIDSELGECFDLTQSMLLNGKVTLLDDGFPVLQPGANIISWTGAVTKITIAPRWRDL